MRTFSRRAILVTAAVALARPRYADAQGETTIRMAGVAEDSATTALYAIRSGLFKKYGLSALIETQHNGPAIMSGVIGNSYQFGKASTPPLIVAVSRGLPLVIAAPGGLYTSTAPIAGLLVKSDSPLRRPKDIAGKTIAVGALNDVHSLAVLAWLDKNGIDASNVKFTEIPIPEIPVSIAQGRVDAGSVNEPVFSAAQSDGKLRVLAHHFDAIAPRFMYTAWFTTKSFAAANPAAVRSFARAMVESARYCNAHHAQTVDLIADYTKLDRAVVAHMTRVEQGTSLDPSLLRAVIDAMMRYKFLSQPVDVHSLVEGVS